MSETYTITTNTISTVGSSTISWYHNYGPHGPGPVPYHPRRLAIDRVPPGEVAVEDPEDD